MKAQLISQKDFLRKVDYERLVVSVFPIKFANGYFVKGTSEKSSRNIYSTINNQGVLQQILDNQRSKLKSRIK
ncbi:MAG: hypothetical protein ABIJ14_01160 [Nanoarchaeota archaeon]